LDYFDDFFADPASLKVREFYEYVHEWLAYLKEHEGEFNYLEDEEWRERKDRVLAVLTEQEDLREEFEDLQDWLESAHESKNDQSLIAANKEWLAFMKRNQTNYGFTDEDIAEGERRLQELIISVFECEAAHERLKRSEKNLRKSIEKLDEGLSEHYRRTGKRLVMTSLAFKFGSRLKGN
jgi:hypothetical protein